MPTYIIAGLGNPGKTYSLTRHNIGAQFIDYLALSENAPWKLEMKLRAHTATTLLGGDKVIFVKPTTYMNESGLALQQVLHFYKLAPSQLIVAYDDISLDLGRTKLSMQGSAGGHNGIRNIISCVGEEFCRFKIGIGEKPHPRLDLKDYVLGRFLSTEYEQLVLSFPEYKQQISLLLEKGPLLAMNFINQRKSQL